MKSNKLPIFQTRAASEITEDRSLLNKLLFTQHTTAEATLLYKMFGCALSAPDTTPISFYIHNIQPETPSTFTMIHVETKL